ncbi:hypothetical protein RHS01_02592 [Rhizoctonia solani]|uniref:Uncharacterized protein n=1 Tax=Rhizoctonia solani TaxID=456999 RepID=A0A8H7IJ14_9AGAM|nr:hypothetical protein RHS01_02592 [Rhizoctonia solani]
MSLPTRCLPPLHSQGYDASRVDLPDIKFEYVYALFTQLPAEDIECGVLAVVTIASAPLRPDRECRQTEVLLHWGVIWEVFVGIAKMRENTLNDTEWCNV